MASAASQRAWAIRWWLKPVLSPDQRQAAYSAKLWKHWQVKLRTSRRMLMRLASILPIAAGIHPDTRLQYRLALSKPILARKLMTANSVVSGSQLVNRLRQRQR